MPRSLAASYAEVSTALEDLAGLYDKRFSCHETAAETTRMLEEGDIARIFQSGLHEFLEEFISRNNRLGSEIAEAYHFNA
jgi:uncharacterized alpha-E superfamily protein